LTNDPLPIILFPNVNNNYYKKKYNMRFRDFESKIKHLPSFNLNDVRKVDPGFHLQQLNYWQNKRYIKTLAGGYYAQADREIDELKCSSS
jgi:ribonuclease I